MSSDGEHEHAQRPSLRAFFSNWREYDAPAHTKLRLAVRNYWIRMKTRSNCCGNHGQPGC